MSAEPNLAELQKSWHGSYSGYFIGFIASLILTSLSFLIVGKELLPAPTVYYVISAFALIQATVQLIYFLKLGKEGKPYWETATFFFMFIILLIIVLGTLWIMYELNERTMGMQM